MGKVDLHLHSTVSDGRLKPEEVVQKAARLGLTVISLTDHDSVNGIVPALEAAKAFPRLKVIPGVEVSTDTPGGEVHILGYFIDYTDVGLKAKLQEFRDSRKKRARGMISKLANLGMHIEWQRVQDIAGTGSVGRPHIAQAMLEKGYINSFQEAFVRYIGQGGPAYVERYKMTPAEAVQLVLRTGGLPVLAHPSTITDPEAMILKLKEAGLVGVEIYYKDYTTEQIQGLVDLTRKFNFIATGGSDYHGLDDSQETMIGGVNVPLESAEQLIALAKQRRLKSADPPLF